MLATARTLLAEGSYDALTFSDVAARAGVTRQLLYRWWPSKAALVSEALFAGTADLWPSRYPGPLRRDLRLLVGALVDYAQRPDVRTGLLGIMAEVRDAAELRGLDDDLLPSLRASFAGLVEAGQARGDVRAGVDVPMTLDTLRGAVTAHVVDVERPRDLVVEHLVELFAGALAA